jgi:serine/threonine-protein kinase
MTAAVNKDFGNYKVHSVLGAGGMGEVYLAEDTRLERFVALKFLLADVAEDETHVRRFVQEAKAASALNHPNILTVYEIGQFEDRHFIAAEYIKGDILRERMRKEPLDLRETLDVAIQIAAALNAAHEAGIVHRDIKPENVILRDDGLAKVLDFGLAKLTEKKTEIAEPEDATRAQIKTKPGMVMGTVAYMSPEQARGREIDARSDIWSLGVVLYEMLTGRTPFAGETTNDTIAAILTGEPAPLDKNTPFELQRIIKKSLQKKADERYQTVKDFLLDVKNLKRELEFSEELERSHIPSFTKSAHVSTAQPNENATLINQAAISTADSVAAQSSDSINNNSHQTSSAEYVVEEVKKHKFLSLGALAILLLVAVGFGYTFLNRSSGGSINSVAIMPFVNVSKDPNTEYLSDGISEGLINSMSELSQLKVIARSSTFRYKGKEIDPEEVAKTLGVGAIVTGRVVQRGDELQVSVELMNAQDKTQMWGEQYNRRAADLQAVQAEIARTISEKLRLRLTGAQEQQITKQATQNPEAYQLYLTGRFYARKGNIENTRKALDYYTQAVALDPKFALPYASMAVSYSNLTASGADPAEMLAKGRAAAQKALELDDSLAEAHAALAIIKRDEWDWSGAENEFKRAIELNPNLAAAHGNYALSLSLMGRAAEALAEIKRAQELDPLRIAIKSGEASILYYARRYDEAIQVNQNVIKMQPDYANAHIYLGFAYAAKGQYAEAIAAYQKDISISGETPSTLCFLGYAYAMSGKRDEALAILGKLKATKEHVSPVELATLYVGLEDKEAALESLERAYQAHHPQMQYLKVQPHHDALRSEVRFADLMRRVGLPQ